MKLIYLAHPVAGDVEANLKSAKEWRRVLQRTHQDKCVIAPRIEECETFDDSNPQLRADGLERCKEVLSRCDEVWLLGWTLSGGMLEEADHAQSHLMPVRRVYRIDDPTYMDVY